MSAASGSRGAIVETAWEFVEARNFVSESGEKDQSRNWVEDRYRASSVAMVGKDPDGLLSMTSKVWCNDEASFNSPASNNFKREVT